MANKPKKIFRSTALAAGTTLTVPTAKQWIITNVVAVNYTSTTRTFTIQLDGAPLVQAMSLDQNGIFTLDCSQVVDAAGTLKVLASADASITVHISGVERDA